MEQTENINPSGSQVTPTQPTTSENMNVVKVEEPSTSSPTPNINPPVSPDLSSGHSNDGSKTVLFLALFLFFTSLVFLGIYFINAYREDRVGKLTPTPTPQEEIIETATPTVLPTGEDVVLDESEETSTPSATPKHTTFPSPSASPDSFEDFSEIMR